MEGRRPAGNLEDWIGGEGEVVPLLPLPTSLAVAAMNKACDREDDIVESAAGFLRGIGDLSELEAAIWEDVKL